MFGLNGSCGPSPVDPGHFFTVFVAHKREHITPILALLYCVPLYFRVRLKILLFLNLIKF